MAAYREFAGDALWQMRGVRETRTYVVMEEAKRIQRLPILGASLKP